MEKKAFNPLLVTMPLASGLNAATWDYMMNDNPDAKFGVSTVKDLFNGAMDKKRKVNLFLNSVIGAGAGFSLGSGFKKVDKLDSLGNTIKAIDSDMAGKGIARAAGEIALSPMKDLIINSLPLPSKVNNTLNEVSENAKATLQEAKNNSNTMKWLAGAGIAGALGLGGLGIAKYLSSKNKEDKARIKYKLKGKEGDPSTGAVIEMPIDSPEFSENLMEGLNMGIKRQVGKTIKYNSLKVDPETGRKIPYEEYVRKYGTDAAQGGVKQASTMSSLLVGAAGGALGSAAGLSIPGDMKPLWRALLGGAIGSLGGGLGVLAAKGLAKGDQPAVANASQWETGEQTAMRNAVNNISFANTGASAIGFAGDVTAPGSPSELAGDSDDLDEDFDKDASAGGPPPAGPQGGPAPSPKVNGLPGRPIDPNQNPVVAEDHVTQAGKPTGFETKLNDAIASIQAANARDTSGMVRQASYNLRDIFDVEFYPFGVMEKAASALSDVKDIMGRIYNENPSFWPYGLNVEGHNGGVYLIRDKMTKQAAGFVGWQTMYRDGKKVGSYSIGVLPEYRKKGFAKEAVAKIISKKAATVDKVVAYVKSDNYKSKALAGSLGVPVVEKF